MHALKATDPLKEAQLALASRDFRLITTRMPFPVFLGIPEDELVFSARRQYGYKAIASTYELAHNPDFEKLRTDFAQKYNRLIYDFLRTNKELPSTGRAVAH